MDALKKAEQEKKKAAEKLKQSAAQEQAEAGAESPAESSEGPQDVMYPSEKQSAAASGLALEPIEERANITDEFSIVGTHEGRVEEDSDLNISIDRIPGDRTEEDEFEQTGEQPIPGGPSMAAALKEQLDDEQIGETFHGVALDSHDAALAMYEETLQGEPYEGKEPPQIYSETLPGVSAIELTRDIGDENQPTPVAAQTIFTAAASRRTGSGFKWTITVMALIIIIVIALGVLFYQTESITPRDLPSPFVARGIEDIAPAQTLAKAETQPVSGTLINPDIQRQSITPEAGTPSSAPGPEGSREITGPAPAVAGGTAASAETPAVETSSVRESGTNMTGQQVGKDTDQAVAGDSEEPAPQQLPPQIEVTHELFKITRSKAPDKRGMIVNDAYASYQKGDYADAKAKYEKVLKEFPDSRDGLLGLGAIAMREGDWQHGFEVYSRLLTIDPTNSIAKAALINLVGNSGQADRESAIKLMLNENPESSYLYFSLGNVYASQLRWAEAQQAYFDAYRYDSTNPNYALNLAIALDRMGQRETALDYYNTALKLASGKQVGFDEAQVTSRIEKISTNLN